MKGINTWVDNLHLVINPDINLVSIVVRGYLFDAIVGDFDVPVITEKGGVKVAVFYRDTKTEIRMVRQRES